MSEGPEFLGGFCQPHVNRVEIEEPGQSAEGRRMNEVGDNHFEAAHGVNDS